MWVARRRREEAAALERQRLRGSSQSHGTSVWGSQGAGSGASQQGSLQPWQAHTSLCNTEAAESGGLKAASTPIRPESQDHSQDWELAPDYDWAQLLHQQQPKVAGRPATADSTRYLTESLPHSRSVSRDGVDQNLSGCDLLDVEVGGHGRQTGQYWLAVIRESCSSLIVFIRDFVSISLCVDQSSFMMSTSAKKASA